jgi:hypothetical protein
VSWRGRGTTLAGTHLHRALAQPRAAYGGLATHWSGISGGGSPVASQQGHRGRGGSSGEWWHLAATVGGFGSWRDGLRQLRHGGWHGRCSSAIEASATEAFATEMAQASARAR